MTRPAIVIGAAFVMGAALVGCGTRSDQRSAGEGGPDEIFAETASFETVANLPQRLMVGLSTKDSRILAGGHVRFELRPVEAPKRTPVTAEASYLGLPGMPGVTGDARLGLPSQGIGVYQASVTLPAGNWSIDITPEGPMSKHRSQAFVEVIEKNQIPNVGDDAPRTENLTLTSPGVQQQWLDSLASADAPADPLLHSNVIADAVSAGRPVVVVVSSPAYCISRFCGPITELIRQRAETAKGSESGVPVFVHLEVWKDFEKSVINKAAAEWIKPETTAGHEPWVFVVDAKGKIVARFDNVVDEAGLDAAIAEVSGS